MQCAIIMSMTYSSKFFRATPTMTARFSEILYYVSLALAGGTVMVLIVLIKARTSAELAGAHVLLAYTVFVTTFQLSRVLSAMLYRYSYKRILSEIPVQDRFSYEPPVSFIIPCKNEEGVIAHTVAVCFETDYPEEKLEVIVVNDGSTDRTGQILDDLKNTYDHLTVIHWEKNRGKRHAMAEGFRRATGEIVVQLDSDSYIVPATFRKLIELFSNPEIGAVSAHTDPANADENWITKMQAAYYFMAFRILKAAESTYGRVFCCSGCASAYRRFIIMPVLDQWLNERFLGLPVTWGDDRALTNFVIKQDYKTVYTDEARAKTMVPPTLKKFLKQQVRWKKGWFVNSLSALTFIFRTDPFVAVTYFYPLFIVTILTPFMAARMLLWIMMGKHRAAFLFYAAGIFLVACAILLYYRFTSRENKYWPYLLVWAGVNMMILSFLLFWALITIQNRKWATR